MSITVTRRRHSTSSTHLKTSTRPKIGTLTTTSFTFTTQTTTSFTFTTRTTTAEPTVPPRGPTSGIIASSSNVAPPVEHSSESEPPPLPPSPSPSPSAPNTPSETPAASRGTKTVGPIVSAVAGLVVIAVLCAVFLLIRRRKRRRLARRILDDNETAGMQALLELTGPPGNRVLTLDPPTALEQGVIESQGEALRKMSTARRRREDRAPAATVNGPNDILVQQMLAMAERVAFVEAQLRLSREGGGIEAEEGPPEYTME
ncbi:hypothetical protein C8F01DRAFT_1079651 [Mycena amicta]|nr:hypothetical protein C8F01DRAFT_1079651 [Mycena amicta]